VKSDDSCDASQPPGVHWFEDTTSESAIVHCVLIAYDSCDAVRSQVLLRMWANSLSVHLEVNLIDDGTDISLELTNMRVFCRAAQMPQSRT